MKKIIPILLLGIAAINPCLSSEELPLTPVSKRSPLVIRGGEPTYGSTSTLDIPELNDHDRLSYTHSTRDFEEENQLRIRYQTARMCLIGTGMIQDVSKAISILSELVEKQHIASYYALAQIFHNGTETTAIDLARAYQLYSYGASFKDANCMTELGIFHLEGKYTIYTPQDSLNYFKKAIEDANPKAMYYLAKMYWQGNGVSKDKKLAKDYLRQSASLGYEPALGFFKSQCCGCGGKFQ